jgi:Flp pilus assembly pilin Flp
MKARMAGTILKHIKNQRGAATVEFALMLPYIVCVLLFLLLTYEFIDTMIQGEQKNWYALRYTIDAGSFGRFNRVETRNLVEVEIPGIMKKILGSEYLRRDQVLSGFTGCYREPDLPEKFSDLFPNRYRKGGKASSRDALLQKLQ